MRTTATLLVLAAMATTPLIAQDDAPTQTRQRRAAGLELSDAQRQQMTELRQQFALQDQAERAARQELMTRRRQQLDGILTEAQRGQRALQQQQMARRSTGRASPRPMRGGQTAQRGRAMPRTQQGRQQVGRQAPQPGRQPRMRQQTLRPAAPGRRAPPDRAPRPEG